MRSLVVLALVTWAALAVGITISLGGFADPRPMHNGWARLMMLVATLWVLVWATRTICARRARLLLLAIVASLVAHTILATVLYRQRLELRVDPLLAKREATEPMRDTTQGVNQMHRLNSRTPYIVADNPAPTRTNDSALSPKLEHARQDVPAPNFEVALPEEETRSGTTSLGRHPLLLTGTSSSAAPPNLVIIVTPRRRSLESIGVGSLAAAPVIQRNPIAAPPIDDLTYVHPMNEIGARLVPMDDPLDLDRASALPNGRWRAELVAESTTSPTESHRDSVSGAEESSALDVQRVRARRHVDAAMPPETDRFAMRSDSLPPSRTVADRRPSRAFAPRVERRHTLDQSAATPASQRRAANKGDLAIERGLAFLARVQLDDGRWQFTFPGGDGNLDLDRVEPVSVRADAAATGLALLAFLGAGHDHFEGRYRYSVQHGLDYLCRIQSPSGELFPESDQAVGQVTRFYSHGMATLALSEAYGMTGDPRLQRPALAAIEYLSNTQHPQRGGWRYVAGINTDLSVTGWQFLAIRSAELASLEVSTQTYERIEECLEQCRDASGAQALFRYNPWASPTDPRTRHGREPSTVMTAVGLLMQLHLEADRDTTRVRLAADHLLANLPEQVAGAEIAPTGTIGNPGRDAYYWYYATHAMYQLGGDYWQRWSERLFPLLSASQVAEGPLAGSWDPRQPVPDKWGSYGGRLYVTAMNLLSLEAPYRSLPIDGQIAPRVAERE